MAKMLNLNNCALLSIAFLLTRDLQSTVPRSRHASPCIEYHCASVLYDDYTYQPVPWLFPPPCLDHLYANTASNQRLEVHGNGWGSLIIICMLMTKYWFTGWLATCTRKHKEVPKSH